MTIVMPAEKGKVERTGLPLRHFTSVFGISVLIALAIIYLSLNLKNRLQGLSAQQSLLTNYTHDIARADEVLAMSARLMAATGDSSYEQRHDKAAAELDALIKETASALQDPEARDFVEKTDEANREVAEIERLAIALVSKGERTQATALLASDRYLRLEGVFAESVRKTVARLKIRIREEEERLRFLTIALEASSGVILFALLSAWYVAVRAGQRWSEEQTTLESAIREARDRLERQVGERTAALQIANDALRQAASRASGLMEANLDLFVVINFDGKITDLNAVGSRLTGIPRAAILGSDFSVYLTDPEKGRAGFEETLAKGSLTDFPVTIRHMSGRTTDVLLNASLYRDEKGDMAGVFVSGRDITEQQKSARQLSAAAVSIKEEAAFTDSLISSMPGLVILFDANGKVLRWNRNLSNLIGQSDDQLLGSDAFAFMLESDRDAARAKMIDVFSSGRAEVEFGVVTKSGEVRHTRWIGEAIMKGNTALLLATGLDFTEELAAKAYLKESEERFRAIYNSVSDGILIYDFETFAFVDANPRLCSLFGYTREEILGLKPGDLSTGVSPYGRDEFVALLKRAQAGENVIVEWHCKAKDGRKFWMELSLLQAQFSGHKVLLSTGRDVTARRLALEALTYRDRVVHAISRTTSELAALPAITGAIPQTLKSVGEALQVDRMRLVEQPSVSTGGRYGSRSTEWQEAGVAPFSLANFLKLQTDSREIAAWLAPLSAGIPVVAYADTATEAVSQVMGEAKALSSLMVPISVGGQHWGHIGIDNCSIRHDWLQNEIEKIATLANLIGTLISRELTLAALQGSERRFRTVSEAAQDGVVLIDGGGTIGYWNAAAERILGYTEREAIGRNAHEVLAPQRFRAKAAIGMKEFAATGQGAILGKTLELAAIRKDGVEIPVELSIAALRLDDKWHSVAMIRDISERRRAEQQISYMAHHDSLTGLANRPVFVEALLQAIARAERGKTHCAVLYLDLDHFKDVNDTLGHPTGDMLLQMVGQRLREAVRESDTVARFGGDEFAIIEEDVHDPADAAILAEKLVKLLGEAFSIEGNEVHCGASIGIAMYGGDAADAETLLSHADVALYRAKVEGRGTYRFFTDAMDVEVRARVLLDRDMRKAIPAGEFFLMYQPQIDIETNRIIGLEALLRWQHPTRGLIAPGEFVPVAERSGLIVALGSWVLHEATRQAREWLDSGIAVPLMAVNVSALQFKTPFALEHDVALALADADLPPGTLELELTESALMEATQEHNAVLLQLREAGARLAIDDFGTGYSSLEYLARLPIDRVKIAQNFMVGLTDDAANAKIVKAAIGLAGDLGLSILVEGVETAGQLDLVKSWGGTEVQGYYYSKPLSVADTAAILRVGKIIPAPTAANNTRDPLVPTDGPRRT